MTWVFLIPIFLGAAAVLQSQINRQIGSEFSLPWAVLWNGIVLVVTALVIFVSQTANVASEVGRFGSAFRWPWILPGLLGLAIILGLPFSLQKLSAAQVFVLFFAGQTIFGLVWDLLIEKKTFTSMQFLGLALAVAGVSILLLSRPANS